MKTAVEQYRNDGFKPVFCKGYHPHYNREQDYRTAKTPIDTGFTGPNYKGHAIAEIEQWVDDGGWIGWVIPKGYMAIDCEDREGISVLEKKCHELQVEPAIHRTNNGKQYLFKDSKSLKGSSEVYIKAGLRVTYRAGGSNYLILPPINGRTWERWEGLSELPELPADFQPYDKSDPSQILLCLSYEMRKSLQAGLLAGYEDLDLAYMTYLLDQGLSIEQIKKSFKIVFDKDYKEERTTSLHDRTKDRIERGDTVIGAGSFISRIKELNLLALGRFIQELERSLGKGRAGEESWPEPIPLGDPHALPDFPVDSLPGSIREMVQAVSKVNQVDPAMPATIVLGVLSTALAKKAKVDLRTHTEPLNLYLCCFSESGTRKSSTVSAMMKPIYDYQAMRQEEMKEAIRERDSKLKMLEMRLDRAQKSAAKATDPTKRQRHETEASQLTKEIAETPRLIAPLYAADDITPEALGICMSQNGEKMSIISSEGGIFGLLAGRYQNGNDANLDLHLKAYTCDLWSNHRVGRESKTMREPCLTICLTAQPEVIEQIGKNRQFHGRGLLGRFLYVNCISQVGYRRRQTDTIPEIVQARYWGLISDLMDLPTTEGALLSLSPEAQAIWDGFYEDVEGEMRPGSSLEYIKELGSKLSGNVARIAGLFHFARYGKKAFSLPISAETMAAACGIGGFYKEHAQSTYKVMQSDQRMFAAKKILDYIRRNKITEFKGRDVLKGTNLERMESVNPGIAILLERGYIREKASIYSGTGRPQAKTYEVNPQTFQN